MKIALAQINPIVGGFNYNSRKISCFANMARDKGCELVIFPELAITGYPPRDLLEKEDFIAASLMAMDQLIASVKGIGVICGTIDRSHKQDGNPLLNGAILFRDAEIIAKTYKQLLPFYDVFDETRYFEPGPGATPISYGGIRLGITICEDIWNDKDFFSRRLYEEDPVALLADQGIDLIINVSASPFHAGKGEIRRNLLSGLAKKYRVPLICVNQVGGNDSLLFDGRSSAFDAKGNVAAQAKDFDEDLVVFDIKMQTGEKHPVCVSTTESALQALIMGVRDYLHKCHFSKAVIGLSGGIDSAVTACIAAKAIGNKNVMAAFMPSQFTSQDNYEDVVALAQNLGIRLETLPIDALFKNFRDTLTPVASDILTDLTGQNLQARIRGTLLMAISNKLGAMLLSTGNKSEVAVGYCTLYGDMNGGLAVISDVPKTMVYEIGKLINKDGEIIPKRIFEKAPSAELKPDQRDQDDLPSYEMLDGILAAYVEGNKTPEQIVSLGYDNQLVKETLGRIYRSEYKRRQAPPGLRVTTKSFGEGRRYPIAQGFVVSSYKDGCNQK